MNPQHRWHCCQVHIFAIIFFFGPLKRNKNHKNLDIERFLKQIFPTNIQLFLSKNTIFANFNRLPIIDENFDRPTSLGFVFKTTSTKLTMAQN
jgi:hypothetical protein